MALRRRPGSRSCLGAEQGSCRLSSTTEPHFSIFFKEPFPVTGKQTQSGQGSRPGNGLTKHLHNPLNKYLVRWHDLHLMLNMKQQGRDLPSGGFSGPGLRLRWLGSSCASPRGCQPAKRTTSPGETSLPQAPSAARADPAAATRAHADGRVPWFPVDLLLIYTFLKITAPPHPPPQKGSYSPDTAFL